ncbi:MAG: hypothetical protein ABIF19_08920 [Planctomycetota bacterium]
MKKPGWKTFVLAVALGVMLIAGCGEKEPLNMRKSRAVAAENIALRKQLERRRTEIEMLEERHYKEIQKREKRLADCEKERDAWEQKSRRNVRNQAKDVADAVMAENARLRAENEMLRAQIKELQKEP